MSGCYLTFDVASRGTLFLHWSETVVDGALAYFAPRKTVPKFKFVDLGGRQEIIREFQGPNIKKYYTGICMFMKQARDFQGDVTFYLDETSAGGAFDVYLCQQGTNAVSKLNLNTTVELGGYQAAGVIPRGSNVLQGTQQATGGFFIETAAKVGGGMKFC